MKPIKDMTQPELFDLLFYVSPGGTIVALSKISAITDTYILVDGKEISTDTTILKDIKAKLAIYEQYKLTQSMDNIHEQLQQTKEELLKEDFETFFNALAEEGASKLDSLYRTLGKKVKDTEDLLQQSARNANAYASTVQQFKSLIDETNLKSLEKVFKSQLDDIKPVKNELKSILDTIKEAFNDAK